MNLKPIKTTFRINGSSHKKLEDIQEYIQNNHSKHITKTELINISITEFLATMEDPEDVNNYLIKYNLL